MKIKIHEWTADGSFDQLMSLPRQELGKDWFGKVVTPPLRWAFAVDSENLWFLASRDVDAFPHPEGTLGKFQAELWKYDVAEWFLSNPTTGQYWEFNLSPLGAWWSCGFKSPRVADETMSIPVGVENSVVNQGQGWVTMVKIPLDSLLPVVNGKPGILSLQGCSLAVTSILETPHQIFLTTALSKLGDPDFHLPDRFELI